MSLPAFDLQSHSTHSDGVLPAAGVVAAAADAGVELLALSDHDTVSGVAEALEAGRELGVRVVPAVELSVVDDAAPDIHILGYGVDHTSRSFVEALETFREDRVGRADRMAANLVGAGWQVDDTALAVRRAAGQPVGRPHLAEAVLSHPDNAGRLAEEDLSSVTDVIVGYLIEGTPGYASRTMPTSAQAIEVIHAAGGIAVWAHPFWDVEDADTVAATIARYAAEGLDGVEAFYVTHSEAQTRAAFAAAKAHGLLVTGSSDFHGPEHKLFSRFRAFELYDLTPDLGTLTGA